MKFASGFKMSRLVTACHDSCHDLKLKKGPSLLSCHDVTTCRHPGPPPPAGRAEVRLRRVLVSSTSSEASPFFRSRHRPRLASITRLLAVKRRIPGRAQVPRHDWGQILALLVALRHGW